MAGDLSTNQAFPTLISFLQERTYGTNTVSNYKFKIELFVSNATTMNMPLLVYECNCP